MASLKELAAAQKKRARVMREYKQGPPQPPSNRNDKKFQKLVREGKVIQADLDKMSFKKAFDRKRNIDKVKTFTWRGKRYTTELAKPTVAKKARAEAPLKPLKKAKVTTESRRIPRATKETPLQREQRRTRELAKDAMDRKRARQEVRDAKKTSFNQKVAAANARRRALAEKRRQARRKKTKG